MASTWLVLGHLSGRVQGRSGLRGGPGLLLRLQLLHLGLHHAAVVGVNRGQIGDSALLQELLGVDERPRDVVCQSLPLLRPQHVAEEVAALGEVVLVGGLHAGDVAGQLVCVPGGRGQRLGSAEAVGEVVGGAALVAVHACGPVALVVGHLGGEWAVDGDLLGCVGGVV